MSAENDYKGDAKVEDGPEAFRLVMLFSGKLRDSLEGLSEELKTCSESELIGRVDPSVTDWAMRQNFHREVTKARNTQMPMVPLARIYEDTMSKPHFISHYISNPLKVAFMSRPLTEVRDMYEALYNQGMDRLFQWMKTADTNDPKQLAQLTKIVSMAADRAHGPVAQQIVSRNLNVEVNASREAAQIPDSPEQLQAKIREVQLKISGGFKDVTPTDEG